MEIFRLAPGIHCPGGNVVIDQQKVQSQVLSALLSPKLFPGFRSVTPVAFPAAVSKKKPGPTVSPVAVLVNEELYQLQVPLNKPVAQVTAGVALSEFRTQPAPNDGVIACNQLLDVWL